MPKKSAAYMRDASGLLLEQRAVLAQMAAGDLNWRSACKAVGIHPSKVYRWLRQDPAFRAAYDRLFGDTTSTMRRYLDSLTPKAGQVYEEALDATQQKEMEVTCPACGTAFSVEAQLPDWNAKLRAAEVVLKASRLLKDVRQVEETRVALTFPQAIALAAYRAGREIPPHMEAELREMGALPSMETRALPAPDSIDAIVQEIEDEAEETGEDE